MAFGTEQIYDQGYLNDYCYSSLTKLPLQLNWKPYWGYSDKAEIVHFHGMKTQETCSHLVLPCLKGDT